METAQGRHEGNGWRAWQKREEHEFFGSLTIQHQKRINRTFQTDGGLCHWAHRSSWDWRAAGWLDLCSVNKWPEEQKHKHHKLAWLLRHGPSSGAACMLHVTDTVSGLKTSRHLCNTVKCNWMGVTADGSIHKWILISLCGRFLALVGGAQIFHLLFLC